MKNLAVAVVISIFLFSLQSVYADDEAAVYGPKAYLTEQTQAHYYTNGTQNATVYPACDPNPGACRYGYVEVNVSNTESVLQDIRINLSGTDGGPLAGYGNIITGTNLGFNDLPVAKAGVAVSVSGLRSRIYVNTSRSINDTTYNLTDPTTAPVLNLSLTWTNVHGGTDIVDSDDISSPDPSYSSDFNKLLFTLTVGNEGDFGVSNVKVDIQFATDTNGVNDSVNVTDEFLAGSGSAINNNNDGGDNYFDVVNWTGIAIGAGSSVTLQFNVTLHEINNIGDGTNDVNLDNDGAQAGVWPLSERGVMLDYLAATTLTARTITDKNTKSAIRQGVELSQDPTTLNWNIRGFISNSDPATTNNLSYNVSGWELYDIASAGDPGSIRGNASFVFPDVRFLEPGDKSLFTTTPQSNPHLFSNAYSTNSTITTVDSSIKPFFGIAFDWEVVWETPSVTYIGIITTTLDLPTLHKIDIDFNRPVGRPFSNVSLTAEQETSLRIEEIAQHVGSSLANVSRIEIWSVVPANTIVDVYRTNLNADGPFNISTGDVEVWWESEGSYRELDTADIDITVEITGQLGASNENATVRVVVNNFDSINLVGGGSTLENFSSNDRIIVNYTVIGNNPIQIGDKFNWTGNTTFTTLSGTEITEVHEPNTVSATAKRLIGYKELIAYDPANPNIINVTIHITVEAEDRTEPDAFISGVSFVDYIPDGVEIVIPPNISGAYFNLSPNNYQELTIIPPTYYVNITPGVILPDGTNVTIYNYTTTDLAGWTLFNGDTVNITYQMNVTVSGTYRLPVILAGFDPATGEQIGAASFGAISIDVPKAAIPFQITDQSLSLAKRAIVFKPVLWVKTFEIFNPNQGKVPAVFETEVFGDTIQTVVSYIDNAGNVIQEGVSVNRKGDVQSVRWETVMNPLETRRYEIKVLTPPVTEIDRDVEVLEQIDDDNVKLKLDVFLKNLGGHAYDVVILNVPIGIENVLEVKDEFGNNLEFIGGSDSTTISIPDMEANGLRTVTIIYKQGFPTIIVTPDRDEYNPGSIVGIEIIIINGPYTIQHPLIEVEIYDAETYSIIYANIIDLGRLDPLEKTEFFERFSIPAVVDTGFYIMTVRFRDGNGVMLSTHTGKFFVAGIGGSNGTITFIIVIVIGVALLFFVLKRLRKSER